MDSPENVTAAQPTPARTDGTSPEPREEMQIVVRTAVEQALAPIIQKQREIEQALAPIFERLSELEQAIGPVVQKQVDLGEMLTSVRQKQSEVEQRVQAVMTAPQGGIGREARPAPPPLPTSPRDDGRPATATLESNGSAAVAPARNPFMSSAASTAGATPASAAKTDLVGVATAAPAIPAPAQAVMANPFGTAVLPTPPTPAASAINARTQAVFVRESVDMPWELNGARRRRSIAWAVGIITFVGVAVLCTAMILSQLGYKV